MADTKTADEWKASAAKLDAQIGALERQQTQVQDQLSTLRQQQIRLLGVTRNLPANSPERQQYVALSQQIAQLENQNSQISQQIQTLDTQLQAAERQAGIAQTAPANTTKNTVPANSNPGQNTDPAPVQEPVKPTEPPTDFTADTLELPPGADPDEGPQEGLEEPPVGGDELTVPPGTDAEEEGRQFGLEEPEIIDDSLQLPPGADPDEGPQAGLEEPPLVDDELTVPPGADQEEEGRQPGLAEPPENVDAGVNQARDSDNKPQTFGTTAPKRAPDWRFRIQLARGATYLYKAEQPGILSPLKSTDGVIFPYTPTVSVAYQANYEINDVVHSNFKIYNYRNSSVENISISGDFTAQDTAEANYLLAVIHFFRSVTKMFYGKDQNPARGVPPPLCYITGHGDYAFDFHPVVITNFTMSYPNDVDYITATITDDGNATTGGNVNLPSYVAPSIARPTPLQRLAALAGGTGARLAPGGVPARPSPSKFNKSAETRVPTKLTINLSALPVVTRYNYSNRFSLKDYATGKLMAGTTPGGGIW